MAYDTNKINSLWPSDVKRQHRSGSILASNHYLKQCWLTIKGVLWQSHESCFSRSTHELKHVFRDYAFKIISTSPIYSVLETQDKCSFWKKSPLKIKSLQWCHNEHDGISNHRCLSVYSAVCSGTDQRKYQSSTSLAFVRGIHRWLVDSPHKGPVTQYLFPFDNLIM